MLYFQEEAAEAMWRVSRISIQFLLMFGFTIGIGDLSPSPELLENKLGLLKKGSVNREIGISNFYTLLACEDRVDVMKSMLSTEIINIKCYYCSFLTGETST